MILNKEKLWEFRKNPRFGLVNGKILQSDDIIFLVSRFSDSVLSRIDCMCRVLSILRGDDLVEYFSSKQSGRWKQAGCDENSDRNWSFFENNILNVFSTGIQLEPYHVKPSIDIARIQHRQSEKPWKGIGFSPASDLKRYHIDGGTVEGYFEAISSRILGEGYDANLVKL